MFIIIYFLKNIYERQSEREREREREREKDKEEKP
jgi:hypothetical protein